MSWRVSELFGPQQGDHEIAKGEGREGEAEDDVGRHGEASDAFGRADGNGREREAGKAAGKEQEIDEHGDASGR
jgi:hypothetical protein